MAVLLRVFPAECGLELAGNVLPAHAELEVGEPVVSLYGYLVNPECGTHLLSLHPPFRKKQEVGLRPSRCDHEVADLPAPVQYEDEALKAVHLHGTVQDPYLLRIHASARGVRDGLADALAAESAVVDEALLLLHVGKQVFPVLHGDDRFLRGSDPLRQGEGGQAEDVPQEHLFRFHPADILRAEHPEFIGTDVRVADPAVPYLPVQGEELQQVVASADASDEMFAEIVSLLFLSEYIHTYSLLLSASLSEGGSVFMRLRIFLISAYTFLGRTKRKA